MSHPPTVDYIIIGAGTAGCVIANRLSEENSVTTLILEAGGPDRHPLVRMPLGFLRALQRPSLTWGYNSEPEPHLGGRVIPLPRGRLLGGSSSINGMFHIRGHASDFDEWRDLGCAGWGYADVLPYFKRSESSWRGAGPYHGDDGPLPVRAIDSRDLLQEPLQEAARRAGHAIIDDYDGPEQEGFANGQVAIDHRGRRASSARAFLRPALKRHNLFLATHAWTHRILLEQGRAVGVEYRQHGRIRQVRARKEIILAAGAYNSPQLLLLSGIGPSQELAHLGITPQHHLPGVGRNLIEHPRMALRFEATAPITFAKQLRWDRATLSVLRWMLLGKGPFANQICNGTVLLRTRPDQTRPDIQLLCNPVAFDAALWFPLIGKPPVHSFYVTVCLLRQRSRGHVALRSANPEDKPRVFLNLLSDPDDVATLRDGVKAARRIYRTDPMAALIDHESIPGGSYDDDNALTEAIHALTAITHHPVGTCKMGSDPLAVVDSHLRVHGVAGLRIADASIMPTIPGANTNAATVMIGEKAADLIRDRALPPAFV